MNTVTGKSRPVITSFCIIMIHFLHLNSSSLYSAQFIVIPGIVMLFWTVQYKVIIYSAAITLTCELVPCDFTNKTNAGCVQHVKHFMFAHLAVFKSQSILKFTHCNITLVLHDDNLTLRCAQCNYMFQWRLRWLFYNSYSWDCVYNWAPNRGPHIYIWSFIHVPAFGG